ncbi:Uncharacterised protein [Enterococcus hirae]|nr:Uncharacterised protein [Enterococcus hirae]
MKKIILILNHVTAGMGSENKHNYLQVEKKQL